MIHSTLGNFLCFAGWKKYWKSHNNDRVTYLCQVVDILYSKLLSQYVNKGWYHSALFSGPITDVATYPHWYLHAIIEKLNRLVLNLKRGYMTRHNWLFVQRDEYLSSNISNWKIAQMILKSNAARDEDNSYVKTLKTLHE